MTWGVMPDRDEFKTKVADHSPYQMKLVGDDFGACTEAINQGIDSHLEAVFFEQDGQRITILDAGSLHTLVRRLSEMDDDAAMSLASAIMDTLGYEWV